MLSRKSPVDFRHVGRILVRAGALAATALVVAGASDPAPVLLDDVGVELGLHDFGSASWLPVFVDADLDGDPDPTYMSNDGVRVVLEGDDGALAVHEVSVSKPALAVASRPMLVAVAVDLERDGVPEVLVLGLGAHLLRIPEPLTMVPDAFPMPSMPAATVFDVAAGDLNADGQVDFVVALGIIDNERLTRRGYPDLVFMNLGDGRFESMILEPSRSGFSNGLTLADVDGDRRPDIVESINYSFVVGASRILWNRTPPGARVPVFEVSPHDYDTGTHGMGATVDDVNGDGIPDMFNTSVGFDQLSYGRVDGSFDDKTFELGIWHQWGDDGLRSQWSPSFVDLNADGRLDILVRQGGFGVSSLSFGPSMGLNVEGPAVASTGADLLYVQREDGTFLRLQPPYPEGIGIQGRQAVAGDMFGDGLPDVALGGGAKCAGLWRNVSDVPDGTRLLTVRFRSTVSTWPPTGARVVGSCGDLSLSRMVTSGGKMGGAPSVEVSFAWPECDGDPEIRVAWPSGADSVHTVEGDAQVLVAEEPAWWSPSEAAPDHVTVDPASAHAEEICVGLLSTGWTCCSAADGPCDLAVSDGGDERPIARVGQSEPVALHPRSSQWVLLTDPAPPRPGASVDLTMVHVGDPMRFNEEGITLFVAGEYVFGLEEDLERRVLTATADLPEDAVDLEVSLFPLDYPSPTWLVPTGRALDPRWAQADAYPYQIVGGETEFWYWTAYVVGIRGVHVQNMYPHLILRRPDGEAIPAIYSTNPMTVGRPRMQVSWEHLADVDHVTLHDGLTGSSHVLPVRGGLAFDQAATRVQGTEGGPVWNRLAEHGDVCPIVFVLTDAEGLPLSPEGELVTLEATGAEVVAQPSLISGAFDVYAMIRTEDCVPEGEVRVITADGRHVATFPFWCRSQGGSPVDFDLSWATLEAIEEPSGSGATHVATVQVINSNNESVGADALVTADVDGGEMLSANRVSSQGAQRFDISADPGQHDLTVDVYVNGAFFVTLTAEVDIPLPAADEGQEGDVGASDPAADQGSGDGGSTGDAASPGPAPGCGGCGAGGPPWPPGLLVLGWLLWHRRRKR